MARKKKNELDSLIERAYYKHGTNVEINIMDITKIYDDCRKAVEQGTDLDEAMKVAIAKYRLN